MDILRNIIAIKRSSTRIQDKIKRYNNPIILNESRHVFQKENDEYIKQLKNAISKCKEKLLDPNYKTEKVLTEFPNTEYVVQPLSHFKFINGINIINVYLGICNESDIKFNGVDAINITYLDEAGYVFDPNKIYNKSTDGENVSVIITISEDLVEDIEKLYQSLSHEIIHIMNNTKNTNTSIHSGVAYDTAKEFCNAIDIEFPIPENIAKLYKDGLNTNELLTAIAACMYYLDASEFSAWLDTFARYNECSIKAHFASHITPACLADHNNYIFKIYQTLQFILRRYKDKLEKLLLTNDPFAFYLNPFEIYMEICHPNVKIKNVGKLLQHWQRRTTTFMDKAYIIHCDNILKYKDRIAMNEPDKIEDIE